MPHDSFCFDSQMSKLFFYDDFLGRTLLDEWLLTVVGTGAGALQDGLDGGVYRLRALTNATGDEARIDWNNLRNLLTSKRVVMEVRCKLSSTSDVDVYVSLRFDGNNFIYLGYNSSLHANWRIRCYDGAGDFLDTGVAPDTNYHILRIECHTHGGAHAHFYIDGVECNNSPVIANITASYLQPYVYCRTLAVAEKQLDIDYVVITQDR